MSTLAVHRCRFVDWTPSAITAIAFPPTPLPTRSHSVPSTSCSSKFGVLVVGRANGNIELCEWTGLEWQQQAPQGWALRKLLPAPNPSKVDSLALTIRDSSTVRHGDVPQIKDLRLFSAGGGSELLEWDLEGGFVLRSIASQGGSIWTMAANHSSTVLALGCEDGSVRILNLEDDSVAHMRRFEPAKSRILSIAWGPPQPPSPSAAKRANNDHSDTSDESEDEEEAWTDTFLVTGGSDSSVRIWDIRTGRVTDKMGTDRARSHKTLVWAVGVFADGTVVSGDSLGMVKFWDSRTCTQLQSFQAHAADVLCLAIGSDGSSVYTSGVDQKICQFLNVQLDGPSDSTLSSTAHRWIQSCSRRMHSHDVRALAVWPPYSPIPSAMKTSSSIAPILASGGLDVSVALKPCAIPSLNTPKIINPLSTSAVSTFEDSYHQRLPSSLPGCVLIARQARLILCRRDTGLAIWRIRERPADPAEEDVEPPWSKVLEMDLSVRTNLISSAISDDGKWLAASDLYETKLFRLIHEPTGDIRPKRIRDFAEILLDHLADRDGATGAASLQFTPDSSRLVLGTTPSSRVVIVDLGKEVRVLRSFAHHRSRDSGKRVIKGMKANANTDDIMEVDINIRQEGEEADEDEDEDEEEDTHTVDDVTISVLAISPDGQWLASSDSRCRTHVFNLDSVQYHCTLPSSSLPVAASAFNPSSPQTLVLGLPNNTIQIFDVEARQYPDWSRSLTESLPKQLGDLHDGIRGVAFDPTPTTSQARSALLWSSTWLCKIRLDEPVGWANKKRRRESNKAAAAEGKESRTEQSVKLVTKYRPLLAVDFAGKNELVVVERPLVDVLGTMPPAFFKPKYGSA